MYVCMSVHACARQCAQNTKGCVWFGLFTEGECTVDCACFCCLIESVVNGDVDLLVLGVEVWRACAFVRDMLE